MSIDIYSLTPSLFLFFFNDTASTEIYTLSLHDALPISPSRTLAPGAGIWRAAWWRPPRTPSWARRRRISTACPAPCSTTVWGSPPRSPSCWGPLVPAVPAPAVVPGGHRAEHDRGWRHHHAVPLGLTGRGPAESAGPTVPGGAPARRRRCAAGPAPAQSRPRPCRPHGRAHRGDRARAAGLDVPGGGLRPPDRHAAGPGGRGAGAPHRDQVHGGRGAGAAVGLQPGDGPVPGRPGGPHQRH